MLLLLAGASETARELLADTFLSDHPSWKHLALEDIYDPVESDEQVFQTAFSTIVACECVRDAQKESKCPVLITCPSPTMLETVRDEFPKGLVCVRIGKERIWNEFDFDHEIDTKKSSMKDVYTFLKKLVRGK